MPQFIQICKSFCFGNNQVRFLGGFGMCLQFGLNSTDSQIERGKKGRKPGYIL